MICDRDFDIFFAVVAKNYFEIFHIDIFSLASSEKHVVAHRCVAIVKCDFAAFCAVEILFFQSVKRRCVQKNFLCSIAGCALGGPAQILLK